MTEPVTDNVHHWDFVDESGCLHCNCGIGVIEPKPGSKRRMTEPVTRPTLDGTAGHTPGPWRAVSRNSGVGPMDDHDNDFLGWEIEGPPEAQRGQFARGADARLIAQAPALAAENQKLREALRIARQYVVATHGVVAGAVGQNNLVSPDLAVIDAALASAAPLLEGEGASR